ncbi:hypothetical protein [Bacillus pinisoli]|uniref:hypothetical protein n=1 Tax=Bacillus pinisoli TaxID=2901866 RepID=UPI001FF4B899|nr:hypothetical protein [Bacillus pinisoli]
MRTVKKKEREDNPISHYSDAVNRSMIGDPAALLSGGCLTKVFTVVIILGFIILVKWLI